MDTGASERYLQHHMVSWSSKYERPVFEGKVTNPATGEREDAGDDLYQGPPSVDIIWHNMYAGSDFITFRQCFLSNVNEVFVEIARHVQDKFYKIISVNASAYSVAVIVATEKTQADWAVLQEAMYDRLIEQPFIKHQQRGDN